MLFIHATFPNGIVKHEAMSNEKTYKYMRSAANKTEFYIEDNQGHTWHFCKINNTDDRLWKIMKFKNSITKGISCGWLCYCR